ncbi:hypothetical protein [Nitrosomonas sp. JL21]|uniref:hypothetical protein n=1 Tax=Nitrosomonas sp. JL21 TaxID=153949 RepID=UPI00136F3424|nr:hypothetical protein [Nitrosomonas sp. JL21]
MIKESFLIMRYIYSFVSLLFIGLTIASSVKAFDEYEPSHFTENGIIGFHEGEFLGNGHEAYIDYNLDHLNYDYHHQSLFFPYIPINDSPISSSTITPQILYSNPNHENSYWYCRDSNDYYPQINDCAREWEIISLNH